jgi:hypothetical protein
MKRNSKSSSVPASVMAMILVLPGGAWADEGPYGYGHHAAAPPHYASHYQRYSPRAYPNKYPRYYPNNYENHYPNYSCNNCGNQKHNHNNHDNNNELWYGLLGGGVLGYALGNIYPVPQH